MATLWAGRPDHADEHCPTCGMVFGECGKAWPPSRQDVVPIHCKLPRGHRSAEHWHPSLWPGTGDVLWFDDETQ